MLTNARHSMIPYDKNKGPSQKIMFTYSGRLYQAYWVYNNVDDSLILRINDYFQLRIVLTTKLVDQGTYIIKDVNGRFLIALYAYDVSNIYDPKVWILDASDLQYVEDNG